MLFALLVLLALGLAIVASLLKRDVRQPVVVRRPVWDLTDAVRFRNRR